MIEKLSDEKADEMASAKNGIGQWTPREKALIDLGIMRSRDYYDAQIDKQAKTIHEMFDLYIEQRPDQKIFEYATDSGLDEESGWSFAEAIALFIAAGGTIKEPKNASR